MRRQYASKLNVTTRVTTIALTAITPKKTQKRNSFADFFQHFFLLTHFLSRIIYNNGLLGRNVPIYSYPQRSIPARNFLTQ
jgi:hypothetical protein